MNNKGFAITTILYGILVLFCLLLVSLLGILSSYKKTQEKLINENNGARSILGNIVNDSGGSNPGDDNGNNSNNTGEDEKPENPKLIFICRNGNFIGNVPEVTVGQIVTLNKLYYYCDGFGSFVGWNTDPDAKNTLSSIKITNEDVTLYDVWGSNGNVSMD